MKSQAAICAKAIKAEIKKIAPSLTVRASSSVYSMGNSVHVKVIGEVSEDIKKQISALEYKYQYGHFDGMTDMYECSNVKNDIPQAKYVSIDFKSTQESV